MESPPSGIGKIYIKGGVVSNNEGRVRVSPDQNTNPGPRKGYGN